MNHYEKQIEEIDRDIAGLRNQRRKIMEEWRGSDNNQHRPSGVPYYVEKEAFRRNND